MNTNPTHDHHRAQADEPGKYFFHFAAAMGPRTGQDPAIAKAVLYFNQDGEVTAFGFEGMPAATVEQIELAIRNAGLRAQPFMNMEKVADGLTPAEVDRLNTETRAEILRTGRAPIDASKLRGMVIPIQKPFTAESAENAE